MLLRLFYMSPYLAAARKNIISPHFSQGFVARRCRGPWIRRFANRCTTEDPGGVLDSTVEA
jgi:hypothetical protein